jgi:hypothetical protein
MRSSNRQREIASHRIEPIADYIHMLSTDQNRRWRNAARCDSISRASDCDGARPVGEAHIRSSRTT